MAEQIEKAVDTNKKEKKIIITVSTIAVAVIAVLVVFIVVLINNNEPATTPLADHLVNGEIQYQQGVIAVNEEDLQAQYDEAMKEVQEGYISLNFNNWAVSEDGINFDCFLGNSSENTYDVYYDMYMDSSFQDRIFITGLIPPGSGIEHFTSEIDLDPGTYEAVLVLTQVEDDHATIHTQTSVAITLKVKG